MYKIFDRRTFGLSHQIKGFTTVKVAKTGSNCKIANFTVVGPLIWCDNPKVRLSKIFYINNNDFHHLGRSQICAGAWYVFKTWKPHSETLWDVLLPNLCHRPILIKQWLVWRMAKKTPINNKGKKYQRGFSRSPNGLQSETSVAPIMSLLSPKCPPDPWPHYLSIPTSGQ